MILFDLDDTIFDHKHSRLYGLAAIQNLIPPLKPISLSALESDHDKPLLANYGDTLTGKISVDDVRAERIKNLLGNFGVRASPCLLKETDNLYRTVCDENRRAIPGVVQLMQSLEMDMPLGIVTNGLSDIQREKIDICNIRNLVRFIFISAEIGYKKPEKAFYELVFSQTGSTPDGTVLVGDLWDSDILGGHAAGMQTVWLNRYGLKCPDPSLTTEIQGYEPIGKILEIFLSLSNSSKAKKTDT